MNFLDLVRKRKSVRAYQDKPVERVKIERCLEAARLAPSACNSQPWRFKVDLVDWCRGSMPGMYGPSPKEREMANLIGRLTLDWLF